MIVQQSYRAQICGRETVASYLERPKPEKPNLIEVKSIPKPENKRLPLMHL